jgi:hypothetical protein
MSSSAISFALLVLLALVQMVGVSPSGGGSLLGWPPFLLVIGAAGLVIGLRPSKPLPPAPAAAVAPTIALREDEQA